MPNYVFNNTTISNFAAVGRLDLLETHYRGIAFTTLAVSHELRRGVQAGYSYLESAWQQLAEINPNGWLHVLTPTSPQEYQLQAEFDLLLDPGEAACLALAITRQFIFITDDLAARRLAKARKVPLTGTLGILIKLVQINSLALNEANNLLTNMIQLRYHSPVTRLDELVELSQK